MKNTVKKLSTTMMLLVFALSNSLTTSCAVGNFDELLTFSNEGYTADRPILRGTSPSTVGLKGEVTITDRNIPVSISLRDSDVKQVLRMFADKAGLNIIFKGDIQGNVTMDLVNIPLNSAFDMVLETSDLGYSLSDKTLIITKNDDESGIGRQNLTVLPVKYVDATSIANFLNKNVYSLKKPGLAGPNSVTVNSATNELIVFGSQNDVALAQKIINQFDKKPLSASFKVNHTTPEAMANMICSQLIPGISSAKATGGAAGVMTGAASDSDIVLGEGNVACTLDVEADSNDNNEPLKVGNLSVAYYTQLGTVSVVGGSEHQIDLIKEFIDSHDKKQPQAYLEFSIIELSEDGSRTFNNQWSFTSRHFNINNADQESGLTVDPIYVSGVTKRYSNSPSLVYTLNYLLKNGKARTVSNPRIVVTNGQESTIDMTSDYVKTVTSQVVQGSLNATTQRQYEIGEDDGIKITVTPFISPDGYVYMNMEPDYTMVKDQVMAVNGEASEAAGKTVEDLQATLLSRRNLELKNVRIKDGDTLVIAGMMREYESREVNKIPILGDIPYIGTFFRSTSSSQQKSELVILVTPKIITESDDVVMDNTL